MIDILDLADKAARCVLKGRPIYTKEDWQDATQEAATAIYETQSKNIAYGEGYLFLVAKSAIYDWLRMWLRYKRAGSLLEYVNYFDENTTTEPVDPIVFELLAPMLEKQRATKVQDDMQYLRLRIAGYSTDGIALEMQLSRRNVYAIRERLIPRLERLARGESVPTMSESVRMGKARAKGVDHAEETGERRWGSLV